MIHELRIYDVSPGALPRLHNRFANITLKHWERHGIKAVAFWDVAVGDGGNYRLYYLLEWENLAEREQKWAAFQADEAWRRDRADTEREGPIVAKIENLILQPTSYSPLR